MKIPVTLGVPFIVNVLAFQETVTPLGRPVGAPIPVAPRVVWVIAGKMVFTHKTGEEEALLTVFNGLTKMVPLAKSVSQPPVSGII